VVPITICWLQKTGWDCQYINDSTAIYMERLNLKKLTEVEFDNSYQIKSRNRFATVENLNDSEDINRNCKI